MPVFTYQAKDSLGQTVSGEVLASDERTAAGQVRELGYYPMRVNALMQTAPAPTLAPSALNQAVFPDSKVLTDGRPKMKPQGSWFQRTFVFPIWTNVSMRDLAIYFREFSAMLGAGMSIVATLNSLQNQKMGTLRKMSAIMRQHILAGGSLSEAMEMFPHIFSEMQRSMIIASEHTGSLDTMMRRLADYLEADYALRQMVKRETFMPKINFAATFLLPTVVVAVMPGTQAYLQAAVIPLLRIIIEMGMIYTLGRFSLSVKPIALVYDTFKAYLPYFGYTVRMLALAKFARALSALYSSGVLLPSAVATASRVAGNAYLADAMSRSVPAMMAGEGLTESFAHTGAFPGMFLSMLGTGEQTGNLDAVLTKVAEFYEAESAVRLHQSVQALGVLMFLFAAFIVGKVVIDFYQGYGSQLNGLMDGN